MGADPLSPFAPARVRVLLLPVGRIKKSRFLSIASRLRDEQIVRLKDLDAESTAIDAGFAPSAFTNGAIHYYMTLSPPTSSIDLSPIELFRQPLVVLCITDSQAYSKEIANRDESAGGLIPGGIAQSLAADVETARKGHSSAIVTQLLVLDAGDDAQVAWPRGAIHVLADEDNSSKTIRQAMRDVSHQLLHTMSVFAKTIKSQNTVVVTAVSHLASSRSTHQHLERRGSGLQNAETDHSAHSNPRARSTSRHTESAIRSTSSSAYGGALPTSPVARDHKRRDTSEDAIPVTKRGLWKPGSKQSKTDQERGRRTSRSIFPSVPSEASAVDRERNIGKARIGIVIATMQLMMGQWNSAWRGLLEHTAQARMLQDWLWHAQGVENLLVCMLLFAWYGYEFHVPTMAHPVSDRQANMSLADIAKDLASPLGTQDATNAARSTADLARAVPDIVSNILTCHEKAASETQESLPQLAHSELVIRLMKLEAQIAANGGELDRRLLQHLVPGTDSDYGTPSNHASIECANKAQLIRIAETTMQAIPAPTVMMEMTARISILAGLASVLSITHMERKRAIVLKQLASTLIPALLQARKLAAAEVGMHPAASLSLGTVSSVLGHNADDVSIHSLLEQLEKTYGILPQLPNFPGFVTATQLDTLTTSEQELRAWVTEIAGHAVTTLTNTAVCGVNIRLDILRACIEFCEALPDLNGIVRCTASLLRTACNALPLLPEALYSSVKLSIEEQVRHISNMFRAQHAGDQLGLGSLHTSYWDDFLVRNVEVHESESGRMTKHSRSAIERRKPLFDTSNDDANNIIVVGEATGITVTLQNPYDVELDIEHLSFVTSGAHLAVRRRNHTLGPARLQKIQCQVITQTSGTIIIHAVVVKFAGCAMRVFPVYADGMRTLDSTPTQDPIMSARTRRLTPVKDVLTLYAIQAQPQVVISHSTMSGASLMLLDGQQQTCQITLRNLSSVVESSFLQISYEDNLVGALISRVREKDLAKIDVHETEWILLHGGAASCIRTDTQGSTIGCGREATFELVLTGRKSLRDLVVCFDIGLKPAVGEKLYTRQIRLPLHISGHTGLQVVFFDLMPLCPDEQATKGESETTFGESENCMMILDLCNDWSLPLELSLTTNRPGGRTVSSATKVINVGHISRIMLACPRIHIDNPYAAIPALQNQGEQQYVVDKTGISIAEERTTRELFWYREEMLKQISATWKEVDSDRAGVLDLRPIVLDEGRLDVLRLGDLDINMHIVSAETTPASSVSRCDDGSFALETERQFVLRTTVHNRSTIPIKAVLRLHLCTKNEVDGQDDIDNYLHWSGPAERPLASLEPNATLHADLPFYALSAGIYEVAAMVEEVSASRPQITPARTLGQGEESIVPDLAMELRGRRAWNATPCILHVRDDSDV